MANDLITKIETAYGIVELSSDTVNKYLARGNATLTEQEIRLFIELCKYQKLNPFVNEAYPIKFGNEFQMIIGYDTYKRRAEENPGYYGRESGIVVLRGDQVVQKKGTCLYPNEKLLGGWCRVWRKLDNGEKVEEYKEVALDEYQKMKDGKPVANWGTKPCTMIEKVAVSQALRNAFPKDFAGMYTEFEMGTEDNVPPPPKPDASDDSPLLDADERKALFELANLAYGDKGVEKLREMLRAEGYESTQTVTQKMYNRIAEQISNHLDMLAAEAQGSVQ